MEFDNLKQDKGVAGMNILIGLVVSIFILAILVMSIALLSDELEDAIDTSVDGGDVVDYLTGEILTNESTITFANSTIVALDDISCSLYNLTNGTEGSAISTTEYTVGGVGNCYVIGNATSVTTYSDEGINSTYSFTYSTETTASGTIENASQDISSTTEWFTIFIVMGAIVVIMLLVAIIIQVAKGFQGGNVGGSSNSGRKPGNIGSA